eukprot:TRINITY_DN1414_c0_g1_i1.p1 TRINITY_DN1414_c0_g1~~TRINITY_DN1414_c0_g1_i1.p1  ORF type:complete len:333 (+),score=46.53 TRINITY_DN1414_c0_g1_i1:64-1062(+)
MSYTPSDEDDDLPDFIILNESQVLLSDDKSYGAADAPFVEENEKEKTVVETLQSTTNENQSMARELNLEATTGSHVFQTRQFKLQEDLDEEGELVKVNEKNEGSSNFRKLRTSSFNQISEDALSTMFTQMEQRNKALVRELSALKQRMTSYEKKLGESRWGLRYSRRMAIVANFVVGIWIFWRRLLLYAFKNKKGTKKPRLSMAVTKPETFLAIYLKGAYFFAISQSWYFFVASLLLVSKDEWKRQIGLILSTSISLFMAYKSHFIGSLYGNLFANILYATADWSTGWSKSASLDNFVGNKTEKLPRSRSVFLNHFEDNVALMYLNEHFSKD